MHELVTRIREPDLCYVFARNARRRGHGELALQALRRAVELKADRHEVGSEAELAAVRAIYAYEEALSHLRGRRTRATGTWQLVRRHGALQAVGKRLKSRDGEAVASALRDLQLEDYSFEAVARAYPDCADRAAA